MILKNGLVFTEDARFVLADVEIADGKIAQVAAPGTLSFNSGQMPHGISMAAA